MASPGGEVWGMAVMSAVGKEVVGVRCALLSQSKADTAKLLH